jgi:hypothetical protein
MNLLEMGTSLARTAALSGNRELCISAWKHCVSLAIQLEEPEHFVGWIEEAAAWIATGDMTETERDELLTLIETSLLRTDDDIATYRLKARQIALRIPDLPQTEFVSQVEVMKTQYEEILENDIEQLAPLHDIGVIMGLHGHQQAAIELFFFVRNRKSRVGHPTHPYTISTTVALSDFQLALGLYQEALMIVEDSIDQVERSPDTSLAPLALVNELRLQRVRALIGGGNKELALKQVETHRDDLSITFPDLDQLLQEFLTKASNEIPQILKCQRCLSVNCPQCGGQGCQGLGRLPLSRKPFHVDDPGVWCKSCVELLIRGSFNYSRVSIRSIAAFLIALAQHPGKTVSVERYTAIDLNISMSAAMRSLRFTARKLFQGRPELCFSVVVVGRRTFYYVNQDIAEVLLSALLKIENTMLQFPEDLGSFLGDKLIPVQNFNFFNSGLTDRLIVVENDDYFTI